MYLIQIINGMREMKLRCLALLVVSVAAAIAITFNVSLAHGLVEKPMSFGVAETQLLVNTGHSPLADVTTLTLDVDLLAGDLAELAATPQVIGPVAHSVGVPVSDVSTQSQLVQDVPLAQSDALEAQRGTQIVDGGRHYSVLIRVDEQTFVIQLFTQAPTSAEAVRMANAAAQALSGYVGSIVRTERIPKRRSAILTQLEPAYGGTVGSNLEISAAVVLAVVFFSMGLIALFALRRWRRAWVRTRPEPPYPPEAATAALDSPGAGA